MKGSLLLLTTFSLLTTTTLASNSTSTPKRGLINPGNVTTGTIDLQTFLQSPALTWVYDYTNESPSPSSEYGSLNFVPQQWNADSASQLAPTVAGDMNITHVLGFNEPDASGNGQSGMTPSYAAEVWKQYIEPLAAKGIKLGAPAVTGSPAGKVWLQQFFGNCTSCTIDFIPLHYYGTFEGLASHCGDIYYSFDNRTLWITEFALDNASEEDTLSMMQTSLEWLDALEWVERYSWFGSFRSDVSNVGGNAAFLDGDGQVTALGRLYLGNITAVEGADQVSSGTGATSSGSSSSSTSAGWKVGVEVGHVAMGLALGVFVVMLA
ncbi:hypothetical protein YB2330_006474 [Saitoella coloradoensis]